MRCSRWPRWWSLPAIGVFVAPATAWGEPKGLDYTFSWPLLVTQAPGGATDPADGIELPDGVRIVQVDPHMPEGAKNLTSDFAAAGWPDVSFDAARFLFIGKRSPDDDSGVWEFNLADGAVRRILDTLPCRRAVYLSKLYALELDRPEDRIAVLGRPAGDNVDAIFTLRPDGSDVRRITFSPHGVADLYALTDGRVLFSMPSAGFQLLYTIHMDGADLFPFAGLYDPPAYRGMPREAPDGNVVFVESVDVGSAMRTTTLASVDRGRSLRTRRALSEFPAGAVASPYPLPDGRVLAAYRPRDGRTFGVYVLDSPNGRGLTPVFDDADRNELGVVAIAPRPPPAGRSSGLDRRSRTGQVYCLNAYLSDPRDGPVVPPGRIDRVRIVGDNLGAGSRTTTPPFRMEATVESDGSFFVEVPAEMPLRIETLDAEGQVLRAMSNWTWVMPGEERGCIGCHEDRELSPPNRHVLALRKPPQRAAAVPARPEQASRPEDLP